MMVAIRQSHWLGVALLAVALALTACSSADGPAPTATTDATGAPTPAATSLEQIAQVEEYQAPHDRPGPAADTVYFNSFHVDRAPLHILAGDMDLYLFSLKTAAARQLLKEPAVNLREAPATTLSIILNPAPAPEGELNPFSNKRIRQAVQLLVNREFILSDIYQGKALPMVTHLSASDFDFLTVYDLVKGSDIRYDPERARSIIQEEMPEMGAQLVDDMWEFEGRPVRLKFIIRVEDERRDIGDLLRVELEKAGFSVAASYQQFAPAVLTVYSSDPQAFEWHLYTEGWGRSAPQRYDFATINQMAAPWQGNMPGWREIGFWQYENEQLDEMGKRIFTGDFSNAEERDELYRSMTELAMDESVRIGVVTVLNSFPMTSKLRGVTEDLVAGPRGPWTIREAYTEGSPSLTVGNLWVWTERTIWNPVGGFGDVYSNDIFLQLHDPPVWNHPFTGIPMPFRADFRVETAGPEGKLDIPADAVMWNGSQDRWQSVGQGAKATSKATFDYSKYFKAKWHHGQPITMADVIYSIAQSQELAFDTAKSKIEFAIGVTARPYLNTIKGYRILDENRMEVYADFWHFDERQIASYASPTGLNTPWEILAAMDELVFEQRRAAYSGTSAARFSVPWLSLVMDRDARLVVRTLKQFSSNGALPETVFQVGNTTLATLQEAQDRYQAAINWFDQYGLLVISNGPFMLTRYDPPAQFAELQAYRDPSYPYRPGDWYFGAAPWLEIGRVTSEQISAGQAAEVTVQVEGPGTLGLRYVLVDPVAGTIVASGEAGPSSGGQFTVPLSQEKTSGLAPGVYQLSLAAFSDEIATLAERIVDIEVVR
jgi:peptide/nickel transport system substrate-binding protein